MSSLLGSKLDRYELASILGQGGFGTVFRARHVVLDTWFALKVLHADRADESSIKRFLREAKTVAAMGSPHIVRVSDGGVTDEGVYFIAMELLEGSPLDVILEAEGKLDVERVIRIGRHLLMGLQVAHEHGVVHRDLKPANVFITSDEEGAELAKILDFGISKIRAAGVEDITRDNALLGTPRYMAPEQLFSSASVDARADLYSLACVLYRALSGALPFDADSVAQLALEVTTGRAVPLGERVSGLPPGLEYVVDRGLSRDPDGRWSSAAEMLEALDAVQRGDAVARPMDTRETERPTSTADTSRTVAPRSSQRWWWIVAALALLVGVAGFFVSRHSPSEERATREQLPEEAAPFITMQTESFEAHIPSPPVVASEPSPEMEARPREDRSGMMRDARRTEATPRMDEAPPASRELPRYVIQRFKTCPFPAWRGRFTVDLEITGGSVTSARARGNAPNEVTQCLRLALTGGQVAEPSGSVDIDIGGIRVCAHATDGWRTCSSW